MKTIIEKRFDQLEPGDVLPGDDGYALVVYNVVDNGPGACRDVWCVEADRAAKVRSMTHKSSELFAVECRDLTPAQQHADELLELVRATSIHRSGPLSDRAQALIDKIDPPQPPTLDEALALLAAWPSASRTPLMPGDEPLTLKTEKLLDRARRSGVLS